MKKSLFFCVAALALASCSKNEVTDRAVVPVNSDVIGFNTSTGSTRGADFTSAIDLYGGFNVIGESAGSNSLFAPEAAGTVSNKFLYDGGKWKWEFETPDKKWPNASSEYPLTFAAAFPLVPIADFAYEQTITIDNTDISKNADMLSALAKVETKPTSGVVALTFKHILSKIAFQIVSPVGYKVYIQSVTLKNIANDGARYAHFTGVYAGSPSDTDVKADFNHVTSTTPVALVGLGDAADKGVVIKSIDGTSNETWKLMPQQTTSSWDKAAFTTLAKTYTGTTDAEWDAFLAANPTLFDGAMIEVVYRMEDAAGKSIVGWKTGEMMADGVTPADKNYNVKVAFPLNIIDQVNNGTTNKGWLMANSYTYQIKFGTADATNGTVVDPSYKEDNGTDTDKPVDNPTVVKPGEDITPNDRYIGFDVLVDEWTDNSTEIK